MIVLMSSGPWDEISRVDITCGFNSHEERKKNFFKLSVQDFYSRW